MFQFEKVQNSIPGYTGFIPTQETEQDLVQMQGNRNHIPGYQGFVSGIKSENLYGKTFGKTTLLSSTQTYYSGLQDYPPNVRYVSTIQENFVDQRHQKANDVQLYGKLDPETSQALAYTLSNLTQGPPQGNYNKPVDVDRHSHLTYEQAVGKIQGKH